MSAPFLDATARHPLVLPNGESYPNTVWLARVIDHPNWSVGEFSYYTDFEPVDDYAARLAPYIWPGGPERIEIGRFCALAHGVRFMAAANHPMDGFSTYPFSIFSPELAPHYPAITAPKPPTRLGHDVWVGQDAKIMPGVSIGNGAIVGSGAVVTRNVAPWTIVAGNPARVIRRRFSEPTCALLDRLAWWHRPLDEIRALVPLLAGGDEAALARVLDGRAPGG